MDFESSPESSAQATTNKIDKDVIERVVKDSIEGKYSTVVTSINPNVRSYENSPPWD